ncbi:OmpP1/FadL family transporter [Fusobacterium ulcerans]|uniref:OmpP1/FadL family transporter n=1 Tax=Fusobacterium ulcerans TaxID=861 RepID=UPI001D0A76F0|nr:outer membrane protein transport protein [Fusobacterium ulcerans]MCB8566473.1 outer membrane protein transport protein [Fusobacterium ulcerans]MCB8650578.1 outer membrane protein transport protein [Fusobacterium ulcerans]
MRKKLGILALTAVLGTGAYAASIDHIQTYTPEYLGNQAQNGMINNVSVYYNPAGLMQLERGTYFHAGMQIAFGTEEMKYKGKKYEADLFQPIPNFSLYSVRDERAIFWTFGALGGGGDLEYKDGVAGIAVVPDILAGLAPGISAKDMGSSAEGTNMYVQNTLGRAWMINDKLSMSIAARAVLGMRNLKGDLNVTATTNAGTLPIHADIDSERTAWGIGGQIGFNYKASDRLNLALRYDSRVKMNFKASGSENKANLSALSLDDLGFSDFYPEYKPGSKYRRDLPALLAAGASYKVTDRWTMALSGNYYFNKDAKMDKTKGSTILATLGSKHFEPEYDNGWEIAVGTEYKLTDKWTWIGSVNYADTGAKKNSYDDIEYALNSIMVGTGLKYKPNDTMEWVATVTHFFYDGKTGNYVEKYPGKAQVVEQKYDKSISAVGLGFTKKF